MRGFSVCADRRFARSDERAELGFAIVLGVRLLTPVAILRWPLGGTAAAIAADTIDILIFNIFGFPDFIEYQQIDKILDSYYMALDLVVAQRWAGLPRATASALFAYRMIGVAVFEITDARAILLVFPNVFEPFFLLNAWLVRFRPAYVLTPRRAAMWLAVFLVPKLAQEYLLHYARVLDDYVATEVISDTWRAVSRWARRVV